MNRIKFIFSIAFVFSSFITIAQNEDGIRTGLENYYKHNSAEKIYVQTDKILYTPGETVWYKVYVTAYGVPSSLSKIVYVQLVNSSGNIIIQNKLPLIDGKSHGDFRIPDSLAAGNFQIRSFTTWMLNFDEDFIFHKSLVVKQILDTIVTKIQTKSLLQTYHFQFFPEGGDLVDSVQSNVAFKATNENGVPVNIRMEIKDQNKILIDSIKSFHDGMGKFLIRPFSSQNYSAVVHFPDSSTQIFSLPPIKRFGISMRIVEQTQDYVSVQITYHEKYAGQYQDAILAAYQSAGKIATYPLALKKGHNIFNIDTKEFVAGILSVTIFDSAGIPEAERIVFLKSRDNLQFALSADTLSFDAKTKSAFSVNFKGNDPKINKVNISLSVTDADRTAEDIYNGNIFSTFFISTEFRGYIHNPDYYFINGSDSINNALDLVMLTNGWRHFKWEEIFNNKTPQLKYAIDKKQYIAGEILNYDARTFKDIKLKLVILNQDSSKFIGYAEPDSSGRFVLKDYEVQGKSEVLFQEERGKSKVKNIKVHFFSNTQDTTKYVPFVIMPAENNNHLSILKQDDDDDEFNYKPGKHMLKTVVIRRYVPTKTDQLVSKYVTSGFTTNNARTVDLINNHYSNGLTIDELLMANVPGLLVYETLDTTQGEVGVFKYHGITGVASDNAASGKIGGAAPYFFVNEVQSSWSEIKNMMIDDIALIQFLPPPAPMAPMNGGFIGVISVYTRKWDEGFSSSSITQNYNQYIFHGYSITREFYSPDYGEKNSDKTIPDHRSTLYWNHDLVTDENDNIHFSFYNSDHAKKFRVIIEGMSSDGKMIYYKSVITK